MVAIERDAGFDDDGLVTAKVTFKVGGKTITKDIVFDSSNPMNPGTVSIELAPDAMQTVTVLPEGADDRARGLLRRRRPTSSATSRTSRVNLSDNTPLATVENAAAADDQLHHLAVHQR